MALPFDYERNIETIADENFQVTEENVHVSDDGMEDYYYDDEEEQDTTVEDDYVTTTQILPENSSKDLIQINKRQCSIEGKVYDTNTRSCVSSYEAEEEQSQISTENRKEDTNNATSDNEIRYIGSLSLASSIPKVCSNENEVYDKRLKRCKVLNSSL